jgi:putative nucleotidyltransferase with HDIG domain
MTNMSKGVITYVLAIAAAAIAALAGVYIVDSSVEPTLIAGPIALTMVAFIGAIVNYRVQGSVFGEVSFIPYLTAIVLYPSWATLCTIGAASLLAELLRPKLPLKRLFNVSQIVLAGVTATVVYTSLGGVSLQLDPAFRLLPHAAAVTVFLAVNSLAVAIAVSLAEKKSLVVTWVRGNAAGLAYDVVAIPAVYAFARTFVDWGWWGVVVLCFLLWGLRLMYQSKHQLETTNRELLELFVHTVEFRDPYTSGHSQRVSRYSRLIAEIIGLNSKAVERISVAALLHDVGKIHEIFAPILMKPGRLTPEERSVMELHPIKGAELVEKISDLRDIVPAVRHHHENWDGTGYPDRLAGNAIPIAARIIRFADTMDAMLTDRPYRKALSEKEVRSELSRFRAIEFDPEICDALLGSDRFGKFFELDSSEKKIQPLGQFLFRDRRKAKNSAVA